MLVPNAGTLELPLLVVAFLAPTYRRQGHVGCP